MTRKIVGLALLNVLLLAALIVVIAASQFGVGTEALMLGPARDRISSIANALSLEFESGFPRGQDELLAEYRRRYNADVFLTTPEGQVIAGPEVTLPRDLIDRIRRDVPPPPRGGPPPGRDAPPREEAGPLEDQPGPPPPGRGPPRDQLPRDRVFLIITHNPTGYWAGARIPVSGPGERRRSPGILLLRSSSMFNSNLFFDWRLLLGIAVSVIGVSVLCWWPFVRGLTTTIAQMDRVTEQIAEGRFDAQVEVDRRDELGHLGSQINRMASRLQGFVTNQKRFLGDIAHELCAPLARIQFALGILERKAADAQLEHVAVLNEEIQEMSGLVNELLSFSKAGMQVGGVPLTAVDVASVVQRAVIREAGGHPVEVTIAPDLMVTANEAYLLRALSNLLRNAIRYAAESGPITISARRENGEQVAIIVADRGPGLPESELEEVFAPFYRPETARTRETGGAGLGLAIVRTCIEACKGTVMCRNRVPSGLEVMIRLGPRMDAH
jgi:two-component system, OmpR family, sensor histidine kinase CpxA